MLRDMAMKEQCERVHEVTVAKGFWDHLMISSPQMVSDDIADVVNPSIFEEKIALMHSEASEILEARRDKDEVKEAEECADLLIRLMDYCAARGFDLGQEYVKKMLKNKERPYLHGRQR